MEGRGVYDTFFFMGKNTFLKNYTGLYTAGVSFFLFEKLPNFCKICVKIGCIFLML